MELMNTPMIPDTNENEIQTEQNKQQDANINQLLNEKNIQLAKKTFIIKFQNSPWVGILPFDIFVIILAIFGHFDLLFRKIIPIYAFILTLIVLYIPVKKIILVKDPFNKKILIKVVNYLCLNKMKLNFDLENIHFYIQSVVYDDDSDEGHTTYRLFIINNYKNLVGIDLNESNIKQKPAKCFYSFKRPILGGYKDKQFQQVLNDFVGSSRDYKNSLYDRKCVKFSEYFFSYYLKEYQESRCDSKFGLYCFENILVLISIMLFISCIDSKFYIGILLVLLGDIIINLIIYFIYKCCKYYNDNILRIDFIKSKDFNRIFIGIVKYTETQYVNTFEFQKDNIDIFIFETEGNFNLKVIFKNNDKKSQQICALKNQTQNQLEALIRYLNGEFMKPSIQV